MKEKGLIGIYIFIIILMLYVLFIFINNNILIDKYNNKEYMETKAKFLTNITFNKSYISNYNYANILYQNQKYEQAIKEYKKAMKTVIQKENECKIRINCALAICKSINVDETNQESIKKAIEEYKSAINILEEKQCSIHNEDAKRLKKDIEEEIDRLNKLKEEEIDDGKDDGKDSDEDTEKDDDIEEKIKKIKEETIKEQRRKENNYKKLNKKYKTNEKNW